jgi:hypothetical protein
VRKVVAIGIVESLSLAAEPRMIRSLARQHGFEDPDVQDRPQFFEPDLAFLQIPSRHNAERFQPFENANQRIYVLVPEIKFDIDVGSHRASPWLFLQALWGNEHIEAELRPRRALGRLRSLAETLQPVQEGGEPERVTARQVALHMRSG